MPLLNICWVSRHSPSGRDFCTWQVGIQLRRGRGSQIISDDTELNLSEQGSQEARETEKKILRGSMIFLHYYVLNFQEATALLIRHPILLNMEVLFS